MFEEHSFHKTITKIILKKLFGALHIISSPCPTQSLIFFLSLKFCFFHNVILIKLSVWPSTCHNYGRVIHMLVWTGKSELFIAEQYCMLYTACN